MTQMGLLSSGTADATGAEKPQWPCSPTRGPAVPPAEAAVRGAISFSEPMAKILIVDDSPTVLRFVQRALRLDGHEVESLDSFIQLTARVREAPPDLLILDLNIPALSGVSMGRLVRKHEARDIPIVIYSSRPPEELEEAARAVHAVAHVQKSDCAAELRKAVARVLATRRAVHE